MKTAIEMRSIANDTIDKAREEKREVCTRYTEEVIAPIIEAAAAKGKTFVYLSKDKNIDFLFVKHYLEENGYCVRVNKCDIEVAW